MNKPARFRQSDLTRVIRAAKATGARVVVRPDGAIEIDPASKPEPSQIDRPPLAAVKDFVL